VLRYIGAGAALPDVPARDLTRGEVRRYGARALLRSRLYERIKEDDHGTRA
jgi:hypothetical protein